MATARASGGAQQPSRGDVWLVDLGTIGTREVRNPEQGKARPCLVVSSDTFNHGPAGLMTIVPITTTSRSLPHYVRVDPPEGGLRDVSYVQTDQVRTVSKARRGQLLGQIKHATLNEVGDWLRDFLEL